MASNNAQAAAKLFAQATDSDPGMCDAWLARIVTGDDSARYELAEELSGHHHHHLICTSCGSVADVTLPDSVEATVDHELSKLARRHGFTATAHHLDLVGVCADCSA